MTFVWKSLKHKACPTSSASFLVPVQTSLLGFQVRLAGMNLVRGINSNSGRVASLHLSGTRLPSALFYFCLVVLCNALVARGDVGEELPAAFPSFDFARFKKLNADMAQLAADVDILTVSDKLPRDTVAHSWKRPRNTSTSFLVRCRLSCSLPLLRVLGKHETVIRTVIDPSTEYVQYVQDSGGSNKQWLHVIFTWIQYVAKRGTIF